MVTDMLFKNATILTMDDSRPELRNACLYVKDSKIAYLGEEKGLPAEASQGRVFDATGMLLMPGLVNTHTHIAMSLFRSHADDLPLMSWLNDRIWPMEDHLDSEAVYAGSLLSIAEMLRKGVTCLSDMYFFMDDVERAVRESGIRGILGWAVVNKEPDLFERIETSTEFFRRYNGEENGRITVSVAPHAEYTCAKELLIAAAKRARELGCKLHIHVAESQNECDQCRERWGMSPVQFLDSIGLMGPDVTAAHCVHLDEKDIAIMARTGASVLHCPSSNLKLASGIAPVEQMIKAGVNVSLGTDSAASNNRLDIWEEMRLAALLQKGVTLDATALNAETALKMATVNGAKALGFSQIGMLKEGMDADLIVVDLSSLHYQPEAPLPASLVYGGDSSDVIMTLVQGKVLYEDGVFPTIDMEWLKKEAQRCSLRVRGVEK